MNLIQKGIEGIDRLWIGWALYKCTGVDREAFERALSVRGRDWMDEM